jgi:hypothetical protein
MLLVDCDGTDVALVPWPAEAPAAEQLGRVRRPRVLLVAPDAAPPEVRDRLEDWVRVPVDHRDIDVRARRLARLAIARRPPDNEVGRTARPVVVERSLARASRRSPAGSTTS